MKQCLQLAIMLFFIFCIAACSSSMHSTTMNNVFNVSGKVVDSANKPIVGASVVVLKTTTGVVTSSDGQFSLGKIPASKEILISCIGYKTDTIRIAAAKPLFVVLKAQIVVGRGSRDKKAITCSVSKKQLLSEAIAIRN